MYRLQKYCSIKSCTVEITKGINQEILMTLSEQLGDIVETYFIRYPNMSINGLAAKSGIGATTIRRIRKKNIKGDPAPHVVLGLISAISKEKRLSKIVKLVDGPIGECLKKSFSCYVELDSAHQIDEQLNAIFDDQITYFIYKLAANRTGTTDLEIANLYGTIGIDRLHKMYKLNAVYKKNNIIHANIKDFSVDIEIAAKHLPELVKFYKPSELKKDQNLFYTLTESINDDGIKKIKKIQKEAVKKIYDVMKSPFYEGIIPYFSIQICDTLTPTSKLDSQEFSNDLNNGVLQ